MIGYLVSAIGVIILVMAFIVGFIFILATKIEAKGPCHKYETKMMYNAATKTMMPSRVCVLRGEWVDDEVETSYDNQ